VIVVVSAAATTSAGLLLFDRIADRWEDIPEISEQQVPDREPGEPYTLLLLGSDRRPSLQDERSDTTMLLRLDPARGLISLLSFPRDLSVWIPGQGFDKLNAAYAQGGPQLTLRTLKALTGLEINGVVDVDFRGFAEAVDAVGCVYVDIDREYYAPPGSGYAEIDINAGYQRLCGSKALQYVRFRHSDNDVVRAARQQSFLREARQRLGLGALASGGLLGALVDNTRSTLDGGELRSVARSLFELRSATVDENRIVGDLGPTDIVASDRELERALDRFVSGPDPGGDGGAGQPSADPGRAAGSGGDRGAGERSLVTSDPQFGRYARTAARRLPMTSFYPTLLPPGSGFGRDSRTYEYETEDEEREAAYKLVVSRPHPVIGTEYFGLTGTTWGDPPILRKPSELREIDGREYKLFFAGKSLRLVGWKQDGSAYWLSNSLLESLSRAEMLAIASSVASA
jgi:LCP family protein required for cell wall assembly